MLSEIFTLPRRPVPSRRPAAAAAWRLGGERLEQRIALAVTDGSLPFSAPGPNSCVGNDLETATVFTLGNLRTGNVPPGPPELNYFQGMTAQAVSTDPAKRFTTFDINDGTSLVIANPSLFGTFQSTAFFNANDTTKIFRTITALGTFTPGALGPTTPNPAPASLTITFRRTTPTSLISASATLTIPPVSRLRQYLVAADDLGCDSTPRTYVIDVYTGDVKNSFLAYADPSDARFRGGVRVAIGDVDGDPNTQEVVTAPGPGRVGEIRVFDALTGVEKTSFRFRPFGNSYKSGIELAVGDVNGDGIDDVVAAASKGRGSVVTGLSSGTAFAPDAQRSFTAFAAPYTGGATVAAAGVNQIVVGSGLGMRPTVRTYDVSGPAPTFTQFLPTLPTGTGGVWVTAQNFAAGGPQIMASGGINAGSQIGVYQNQVNPPIRSYSTFATRPRPNAPVYAAAASLLGGVVDTVYQSQGRGGVGGILKVNPTSGVVDPNFAPTYNGNLLAGPLRIATRAPRFQPAPPPPG